MFKLMDMKKIAILRYFFCLTGPMMYLISFDHILYLGHVYVLYSCT